MDYPTLAEFTAEKAVETCLTILLEHGWKADSYYSTWVEFAKDNYDFDEEDLEYSYVELELAWETLSESFFEREGEKITHNGITVWIEDTNRINDDTWVIFGMSDGKDTRYFRRMGYYNSYAGNNLAEGESAEVFPQQVTVTQWTEKN